MVLNDIREFDPERDFDACARIWNEVGWIDGSDEDQRYLRMMLDGAQAWVGLLDGDPECLVITDTGEMRYMGEDLPYALITGVTTSLIARQQGLAGRVTAHALARRAAQGATVAGLGMFDQGYYDRLGFGTGGYEHNVHTSPDRLAVPRATRAPKRLTKDDLGAIVAGRLRARRSHGNLALPRPGITLECLDTPKSFGLGFWEGDVLTHHMWIYAVDKEHGPYRVQWMAYETSAQLRELLGVLKSLGNQIDLVSFWEGDDVQLQHLIDRPFQGMRQTKDAKHPHTIKAMAWWQARLLNLPSAVEAMGRAARGRARFNLTVRDPVTDRLPFGAPWYGVSGDYTVELAPGESRIVVGHAEGLETLDTTVNALTRWWLGVSSAWALSASDDFVAHEGLLDALDDAVTLPKPTAGWPL